ncbi:PREDICTED: probable glycerol-3-phosphate acyltransferase 2 [Nelumbo nucifera]|uniref:Phospholipid/glycerol acyltransferase domain-containing protein n=2 Tax=Nelumbo nucifera TaxID=4432 RepID=A0A822Z5P3_NELNU|nr:PREDICTED: probable glycerol-3-phosphate acyltransferase 2 [Nelumbo nucifera]DAD38316.1 TPA_asm: hypothetical protein HUJ06_008957 [Nelumbo nucifera]
MACKGFSFKTLVFSLRILLRRNPLSLVGKGNNANIPQLKSLVFSSLLHATELSNQTLIFDVEGALLRSSSLFPYFMLVAFEAGGLLRAVLLLFLYPFVCLLGKDVGLRVMVFLSFFGIKKESLRVGRAVLPKFFLEDIGYEGFHILMRCRRRVAVSCLPKVMVEGVLRDYLDVEFVVARELKVVCGYYVGLMEDDRNDSLILRGRFAEGKLGSHVVGIGSLHKYEGHQLFSVCKDIYLVSETEKRNWHPLPRDKYPKPLIFHDGRLAFRPTPESAVVMLLWLPLGLFLFILRAIVGLLLPYRLAYCILAFSGMRIRSSKLKSFIAISNPENVQNKEKPKGILYVCNHRTVLDPLFVSTVLNRPVTAVTYSLSRATEIISPIRTARLTRNREQDAVMMEKLLNQGDLIVCPEGTTCREPYLLRFSPLFAEMSDEIVPVAMDVHVNMFYGTTASGFKWLDPVFFLLNPCPCGAVNFLDKLSRGSKFWDSAKSSCEVANQVQRQLAEALGFECTSLTRKDKYTILAGNHGIVNAGKQIV